MNCDVLIIGGGVLGFSSAYYLKDWMPRKKIVVIDKLGGPGQGNSAKSEGAFRNVFSSKTNFLLADSTIDAFDHFQRNNGFNLNMNKLGYLWLFNDTQYQKLESVFKHMTEMGVETQILNKVKERVPGLVTQFDDEESSILDLPPVNIGVKGVKCGSIDADSLVRYYEQEFLRKGGEVYYNTEALNLLLEPETPLGIPGEPFIWQDTEIKGAKTKVGEIRANTTILALGVWSQKILNPIGIDGMMRPKKRHIFVFKHPNLDNLFKVKNLNDYEALPLTILPKSGVYLKAEISEKSIWVGCADNLGRKFGLEDDPQPELDYYIDNIYHILVAYLPCFKDLRPTNMWAGQYAINSFDGSPVVESIPGFVYVGAVSGSGIMKSDALGRITAAACIEESTAPLFGEREIKVSDLGITKRNVEREEFII